MKCWTWSDVKTYFWEVAFRSRILYLWALELWIFAYSKLHLIEIRFESAFKFTFEPFQQRNSEILNFYLSFQGMSRTDLRKTHSNRFMKNPSGSIFQARSWWKSRNDFSRNRSRWRSENWMSFTENWNFVGIFE